jgi:tetratricopeptide (TPR) repeat protein
MTAKTRRYRLVALGIGSLLVVAVVALRSSVLFGAVWSNSGFVQFNRLLSQNVSSPILYSEATASLEKATAYDHQNDSAWRALGYVAFLGGNETAAIHAWKNAPSMTGELIEKGQEAQQEGDNNEALRWFDLVTRIAPDLADGWYFLGQAFEGQGDWQSAAESYETAVSCPTRERMGYSDLSFRLGRARWQVGDDQAVILAALDQALLADDFSGDWAREQSHYFRGVVLKQTGQGREAAREFAWVVAHARDDYWAHVQLGLLTWELDHDQTAAERLLQTAIQLDETNKWAYRHLGQIYEATGQMDRATAMYRKVLALDAEDEVAAIFLSQADKQE